MKKPKYYTKVVGQLLNYKKNKQRLKKIELDNKNKVLRNMGIDYSSPGGKTHNIADRTGEIAVDRLDDQDEEYEKLMREVLSVEIAYQGLNDQEQFIINRKYMNGRKVPDVEIYTHPEFGPESSTYYKIKDKAIKKMAEIMGYI